MGQVDLIGVDMSSVSQQYDSVFKQIDIENERVNKQCNLTFQLADYRWTTKGKINDLSSRIAASRILQQNLDRARQDAQTYAQLAKCIVGTASDCPAAAIAAGAYATATFPLDLASTGLEVAINSAQSEIGDLEREQAKWETEHECEVMRTDSDAAVKKLLLELARIDLEALKTRYRLQLAYGDIQGLRNQATRLLAEQEEMAQQTINVQAAKNDPNIRIYKNDDIILADRTFEQALADAYKATKVFEYYTSQSYAKLEQLFLIRMVSHGDYNLESYLSGLENAYRDFQQQFGNPDVRVEVLSLRDDILAIPRLDSTGRPLCQAERIAQLRQRLADASLIDERGYLRMPFATSLARLSPLTRNHKVLAVEGEIVGSEVGDTVGRLYVSQRGTGTVQTVTGEKSFYRFPERTAVLNPFFNGVRVFTQDVYRSDHMRDRPLVNTQWELTINQKDELANQDINLQSLTDVRLYVYYTDFTSL